MRPDHNVRSSTAEVHDVKLHKPGYWLGNANDTALDSMSDERFQKPDHYAYSDHEPDDVIESWGLSYRLGQVLRYLCRCDRKKNKLKDLKKALWYLNREIEMIERDV